MILFPFKVGPGETVPVAGYGKFVYYESGTAGGADYSIVVKAQGGSGVDYVLKVGQGFRTSDQYTQLVITNNKGAGTITGVLVLADEGFFDNRVVGTVDISGVVTVSGVVEVVDGGMARSFGDVAYMGDAGSAPAASKYSACQIWNPSTTKMVIVKRIIVSSAVGGSMYISPTTVAAANFGKNAQSKRVGSVNLSAAQLRNEQVAAQYPNRYYGQNMGASSIQDMKLEEPFVLMPSTGLTVYGWTNQDINCTFEFYEKAI
ncbi:hypothetical protein [Herbaspirillum robiniae]|uniref:hypothetical protein n=1 Tax=Herbaspirillum robiniae TaxID=2014887 RepID=UPI0009A1C992|nr:hypothetical protein [Herbaspirillum robiniae]